MLTIYTDGSVKPTNPGSGGYGVRVERDGELCSTYQGYLGDDVTNNQAEYMAYVIGLKVIDKAVDSQVEIHTDSALVVNQVNGLWEVSAARTRPLYAYAHKLRQELENEGVLIRVVHVAGHSGILGNEAADALARDAVDQRTPDHSGLGYLLTEAVQRSKQQQGYMVLTNKMQEYLRSNGVPVVLTPTVVDDHFKRRLHGWDSPTSQLLLRAPQLIAILPREGPTYVLSNTSYNLVDGVGYRVISKDMWESVLLCWEQGHKVVMAYQPFSRGYFRVEQDQGATELGWGVEVTDIEDVHVEPFNAPAGWAPVYHIVEARWRPVLEWLREVV